MEIWYYIPLALVAGYHSYKLYKDRKNRELHFKLRSNYWRSLDAYNQNKTESNMTKVIKATKALGDFYVG